MLNLVEDSYSSKIESNLIRARQISDSWFSFGFNIISLGLVLSSFIYFLYSSYNPKQEEKQEHIKYQALPWLSAVKNVPSNEQYGQDPQIEIGGGISGFSNRSSASIF
jgi:hypothetical protein